MAEEDRDVEEHAASLRREFRLSDRGQRGLFTKSSNEGNELIHDTKDIEWVTELLL